MSDVDTPTTGPVERALTLRAVPLFEGLRARQLAALTQLMREEIVPAGRAVGGGGRPARAVRVLMEGRLRAERDGRTAAWLDAPDVIGLLELLAGQDARLRLTAESDALTLRIDGATLLDLLEDDFAMIVQVRTMLGRALAARQAAGDDFAVDPPADAPSVRRPDAFSFVDCLLALQRAPGLRGFGVAVLSGLLRDDAPLSFAAGELLFETAAPAERLLVVADGTVAATLADGRSALRAGAGSLLGENEALAGLPYAYTAVAATPVTALAISAQALWDVAEDHFHVARALLANCARQLLRLERRAATAPQPQPATPEVA